MKETGSSDLVDQNDLRVNATLVVMVLVTAFIINRWEIVAFQAVALFLTALHPSAGPYIAFYRHILRPAGLVKPDLRVDNLAPHRFAALFGALVASAGAYLVLTDRTAAGWGMVWLLIILASVGLAGWCAGCFTYYMMNRLGLRGVFKNAPIVGTFPGVRPPKA